MRYTFFNSIVQDYVQYDPSHVYIWISNDRRATNTISYVMRSMMNLDDQVNIEFLLDVDYEALSFRTKIPNIRRIQFKSSRIDISKPIRRIAFFASNDAIAYSFVPIIRNLNDLALDYYTPVTKSERADTVFQSLSLPHYKLYLTRFMKNRPDILVLGNDWGPEERFLISCCRKLNIRSICIQESVIDFADERSRRMKWADFVFIQGANTLKSLKRNLYFVTGNPRYEDFSFQPLPLAHKAFINCNFTYGVFEDQRDRWLTEITGTLSALDIDYVISQHPRDTGDLSSFKNVLRSGPNLVHDQIANCSFVITRFSSLIHEAICLGRKVVYYNPHNEEMKYDFEFQEGVLYLCRNTEELHNVIKEISYEDSNVSTVTTHSVLNDYLSLHCTNPEWKPSRTIAGILRDFSFLAEDESPSCGIIRPFIRYAIQRARALAGKAWLTAV